MWNPDRFTQRSSDRPGGDFTCSGIVVTARPGQLEAVRSSLGGLEGVRVHQVDPPTCRIVITQVAASDSEQQERFRRLQQLPGVLAADLVYYHRDGLEEDGSGEGERTHG